MRVKICFIAILVAAVGCMTPAAAQSVKRIQNEKSGIASGVWVGDMFYMSGQLPTPITPADREKGTPAVYGNTQAQAESTFIKIQNAVEGTGPRHGRRRDDARVHGGGSGDGKQARLCRHECGLRQVLWNAGAAKQTGEKHRAGGRAGRGWCARRDRGAGRPAAAWRPIHEPGDRPSVGRRASIAAGLASGVVLLARQAPAESVFTAEQATEGRAAYAKHCASCHMPDLSGNTEVPPLAGAAFIDTWGTRSTKDLFDYSVGSDAVWRAIAERGKLHGDYCVHPAGQRGHRGRQSADALDGGAYRQRDGVRQKPVKAVFTLV